MGPTSMLFHLNLLVHVYFCMYVCASTCVCIHVHMWTGLGTECHAMAADLAGCKKALFSTSYISHFSPCA